MFNFFADNFVTSFAHLPNMIFDGLLKQVAMSFGIVEVKEMALSFEDYGTIDL